MDWTSGTAVALYIAGAIITVGGAAAVVLGAGHWGRSWLSPREPLIAFGHPHETATPFRQARRAR